MTLNGKEILSLEHLETLISELDEANKTYLRNEFLGIKDNTVKKKYKISDFYEEPININLDSFPFFKERIYAEAGDVNNGRLIEVNHYKNCINNIYSDLIVKEVITYIDGVNNYLESKKIEVKFYNEDGEVQSIQPKMKYYFGTEGQLESYQEGVTRRKYLISKGIGYLSATIGEEAGITLFDTLKNEIAKYETVNNQGSLFAAISNTSLTEEQQTILIYLLMY